MSTPNRDSILRKIADAERHIGDLRQQQEEVEATLRLLRRRLSLHDDQNPHQATTPAVATVSAVGKRSSGRFAIMRLQIPSNTCGTSDRMSQIGCESIV